MSKHNKVKLTVHTIKAVRPASRDVVLWDTEINGFGLKVTPLGRLSFFFYYRTLKGVQRRPAIGVYPAMKPEQARQIALVLKAEVSAGGDPSGERQARRATAGQDTVAELAESFLKAKSHLKSIGEIERIFRKDILPAIGGKRAEDVKRSDVTKLLDRIENRAPVMAKQVRAHLSSFYGWVLPRLSDNAVNPVSGAVKISTPAARDRVLTEEELRALWIVLETEPTPWKDAIRLMILTGQRVNEVLKADWNEVDLDEARWTIPAKRAKNNKAHIVPLSPAVMNLLQATPYRSGRVFPKTSQTSRPAARIKAKLTALLAHPVERWVWHDLRRTMATGMQRLGVRFEVTEAALNHIGGTKSGVAGVYQRHDWADEKREAFEAWGEDVRRICKI